MLTPETITEIVTSHDFYWSGQREALKSYKSLYLTRYWNGQPVISNQTLRTELPKAYKVVESYIGSLYAKNPAVNVESDIRARGNPEVAQATANQYLLTTREQIEDATRLAFIYPCSFLKLSPVESVDPLKRVSCAALPPWEVIVDETALSWEGQRYIGHVYLMTLQEAMSRYGKREDEFSSRPWTRWIDSTPIGGRDVASGTHSSDFDSWVRIVEMYDIQADKLLVWSEDYCAGKEYLFYGVKVQVGGLDEDASAETDNSDIEKEMVHETTGIPFKSASGRPVVPIIPVYFSRDPDCPLRGNSLVGRSADQFRELNVMRTYQANGVRRMARQWFARSGFLDDGAIQKIAAGRDGEIIEVDLMPGQSIEGNVMPVPQTPIPNDIAAYAMQVDADINDAGMLAPFTRGEVTKSTATEQNLLAAYTSSEIGRMARSRDGVITSIAKTYNIMLSVILGDEAEPLSLPNPVGPTLLSADDLTGDFRYWAVDSGTTPMSDLAKQQALERLTPLLVQLGADPVKILEEIVRAHQLPESFKTPPPVEEEPNPVIPDPTGV